MPIWECEAPGPACASGMGSCETREAECGQFWRTGRRRTAFALCCYVRTGARWRGCALRDAQATTASWATQVCKKCRKSRQTRGRRVQMLGSSAAEVWNSALRRILLAVLIYRARDCVLRECQVVLNGWCGVMTRGEVRLRSPGVPSGAQRVVRGDDEGSGDLLRCMERSHRM